MEEELTRLKGDKKLPLKVLLGRTLTYIKPYLGWFILAFILILANVACDVLLPLFLSEMTDELVKSSISMENVLRIAILYFAVSALNMVFIYAESMILQRTGQKLIYDMRMDVFRHIEELSQNQFDEMPVGSLVTRVASYTQALSNLFTDVLVKVIRNVMTVIGVYAVMLYVSPRLSLLMLIPVTLIIISSVIFSKTVTKIFRNERRYLSDLNTYLNENLSGMEIIQVFNQEQFKAKEFDEKNDRLYKARSRVILAFGIYRPFVTLVYISSVALAFYMGIKLGLTPGEIVAFYLYLSKFFNPIQELTDELNNVTKALTASERLFNLLDVSPDVTDKEGAREIEHFEGKIEFRHVWFAYKGEEWILKDVSFIINPHETCAFVGATGAGKTTILGLIVRNYDIQKGEILIDDVNITDIRIDSLRHAIGQMLQDVFLFSGSIRTNITLHDETIPEEDIKDACRYVNADSFIDKLPKKLDEEVIERGENFSQGQRQLLSFARTVLHKPQILILDEATANIDTETEVLIQDSLEKMKNIGTMLVVAHRLSTIQHSDQIIVLKNGVITERGTHQELLAMHGDYYKLYKLQFEKKE